ncbi:MAG: hypothetical protein JWN34_2758 [Bryobacterales bacterium]|nr:hypothetical protein [Bryobacterales bacterium]
MKPAKDKGDELRPEYDLTALLKGGVRGKYAKRYSAESNVVVLEPDVHKEFRNQKDVNDALRLVMELRKVGGGRSVPGGRRAPKVVGPAS